MAKKIFKSILSVTFLVLVLTVFFVVDEMYQSFTNSQSEVLKAETKVIAYGINRDGLSFLDSLDETDYRVTVIDSSGVVIYDNSGSDISQMDNHLEREEVREAIETGHGNCIRRSSTLLEEHIYTAIRLNDGNVVRLSSNHPSLLHSLTIIAQPLSVIVLIMIAICLYMASQLSSKIVKPLNDINPDEPENSIYYQDIKPITDRIAAQKAMIIHDRKLLERRRQEFETITANMSEGLILTNNELDIIDINRAACEMFGIDESLIGQPLSKLEGYEQIWSLVHDGLHGQKGTKRIAVKGRNYEFEVGPILAEGTAIGLVLFFFDESYKEANETMRREFASNVSHELKTPLQTICGYTELLKSGVIGAEDQKQCLDKVYQEAMRMKQLIEDVIRLSHLDNDMNEITKEKVDLYQLAEDTVARLSNKISSGIKIHFNGEKTVVYGNRELIESIIFNLCDNAVKYNHENGNIWVEVRNSNNKAILSVKDDGVGIDRKDHERIFERFYRVDKSRSRNVGGTGLGLSIVKHACILNNASISVKSAPGKGSTFTVEFNPA